MGNAAISLSIGRMSKASDPKQAIIGEIGESTLAEYRLFDDDVLLGTYIRPEKTAGGIIIPDKLKEEDRYQGKVGLLLKAGPTAWKYDRSGAYLFEGEPPQINDWVIYRASEGWEMALNGVSCRIISAKLIRGVVSDPSVIW